MAGIFVLSLGLLTGASHGATGIPVPASSQTPGLVDRAQAKACEWSHGLSQRSERESAQQRRHDCAVRHGLDD